MLPELTQDDLSQALDEVAQRALAAIATRVPPVDALALAKDLGMVVAMDERQHGRARMVRLSRPRQQAARGSIWVRPDPRPERLQWAVAHEIGEELAAAVFAALGVDPRAAPPAARETVANQLAGRLLLPKDLLAADAQACSWDLLKLKQRYPTASHELIARRMLDFSQPVIVTIFDQGRRTFRRGNLPFRTPPFSELERALWQQVHDSNTAQTAEDLRMSVQGWPIHEPSWQREILRTLWHAEGIDEGS